MSTKNKTKDKKDVIQSLKTGFRKQIKEIKLEFKKQRKTILRYIESEMQKTLV